MYTVEFINDEMQGFCPIRKILSKIRVCTVGELSSTLLSLRTRCLVTITRVSHRRSEANTVLDACCYCSGSTVVPTIYSFVSVSEFEPDEV